MSAFEPVARAQFADPGRVEVDARQPVLLHADPAEVERILLTLFDNAVHAVADRGYIRIAVVSWRSRPVERAGLYGRLVVEDTGVGMDERTVARAFEPFFTTKGDRGTGLGGVGERRGGGLGGARSPVDSSWAEARRRRCSSQR